MSTSWLLMGRRAARPLSTSSSDNSPRPLQPYHNYNIDYSPGDHCPYPTYFHNGMVDGIFCHWLWDSYEEWEAWPSPPPPPTLPPPTRTSWRVYPPSSLSTPLQTVNGTGRPPCRMPSSDVSASCSIAPPFHAPPFYFPLSHQLWGSLLPHAHPYTRLLGLSGLPLAAP